MKTILVRGPKGLKAGLSEWSATYAVGGSDAFRLVNIESRSALTVTIGKYGEYFYIGCPSYGRTVPPVSDLDDTVWIFDELVGFVPTVDALTIVQVLADIVKFEEVSSDDA